MEDIRNYKKSKVKFYNDVLSDFIQISLLIKVGSFDEKGNEAGLTHLIEHLMFRNLGGIKQKKLYYMIDKMGATFIGKTYREYVEFSIRARNEYLHEILDILFLVFKKPVWTQSDIDKEKKVVLNQINMKEYVGGTPFEIGHYFWNSKFSYEIMGDVENLLEFSKSQIIDWHSKYFCPNNADFIIVGNYSDDQQRIIQKKLMDLDLTGKANQINHLIYPQNFANRDEHNYYIYDDEDEYAQINITFDVKHSSSQYFVNRVLNSVLGEGLGSALNIILREELGFTTDVESVFNEYKGFSTLSIKTTIENQNLLSVLDAIYGVILWIKSEIVDDDVMRVRNFFNSYKSIFKFDVEAYCNYLKWEKLTNDRWIQDINKWVDNYTSVTVEEVKNQAHEIFNARNVSFFISSNPKIIDRQELVKKVYEFRNKMQ